jgi:hypothetical protein
MTLTVNAFVGQEVKLDVGIEHEIKALFGKGSQISRNSMKRNGWIVQ